MTQLGRLRAEAAGCINCDLYKRIRRTRDSAEREAAFEGFFADLRFVAEAL